MGGVRGQGSGIRGQLSVVSGQLSREAVRMSFPSGAEAPTISSALLARLKSCPFKTESRRPYGAAAPFSLLTQDCVLHPCKPKTFAGGPGPGLTSLPPYGRLCSGTSELVPLRRNEIHSRAFDQGCGLPLLRQKKVARMGHGAFEADGNRLEASFIAGRRSRWMTLTKRVCDMCRDR